MLARWTLALAGLAAFVVGVPALTHAVDASPDERSQETRGRSLEVRHDLSYGGPGRQTLDVHRLGGRAGARGPAVLLVHGGAWRAGDKSRMHPVSEAIARAGFVAVTVNYALTTPDRAGFPLQLRQVRAAVRWVRRNAPRLGVDPRRIGALGISAGGHLAALAGLGGRGPLSRGDRLGAVVAWSAPFDLRPLRRHSLAPAIDQFLGCARRGCPARRVAAASPTSHASADDPATLLFSSRRELVPVGQARGMAARLRSAGVPGRLKVLRGARHGRAYAGRAMGSTIAFLRRQLRLAAR